MTIKTSKKSTFKRPMIAVGIGASAGGTSALKQFFGGLRPTTTLSYVIIQHTDPAGKSLAVDVIKSFSALPVIPIANGTKLETQCVYLAPPQTLVDLNEGVFSVAPCEDRAACATVIDHFLNSLATQYTMKSVGIILSGEGSDGSLGLRAIGDQGGMTMVQDPSSTEHQSMPESAIATGAVDYALKPNAMGLQLQSYEDYILNVIEGKALHSLRDQIGLALHKICAILLKETHHDFKHYKTTTLIRRIQRRMQVLQVESADEYTQKLEQSALETDALFKELLINVTSFFRDPEAFESLREEVIGPALEKLPADEKYRVWVAGCSSGEEVYTLAILIQEEMQRLGRKIEVQIIATDIDDVALNQARKGSYPSSIAASVNPERLGKYFHKRAGRYHIAKEVREMCLFSAHNLINDPPFSHLDLISCRNVLIYLGLHLQKKLIPVFHYGLKPGGHLFLGNSESLSAHKDLFKTISAKHRIAQRKATAIRPGNTFAAAMSQNFHPHPHETQRSHETDIHLISQRIVLDEFSSRYAVINDEYQIISVSAGLQVYLDPAEGTFQNHIVKMVRSSLRVSLRAALNEAKKHKRKIDVETATLKFEDGVRRVGITVQPMPKLGDESGLYMVVFHKLNKLESELRTSPGSDKRTEDHTELVEQLERELSILREDLEKTVQDLEASNEELKSSNEELLSMNEELQSANEELETSKEDVQLSSEALQQSHTDLENLLASTEIATLFLNDTLHIQSFTPALEEVYNITSSDIGRPIHHFTHLAKVMPSYPDAVTVATSGLTTEENIELTDGRKMLRRISPYKTTAGTFSGMVVTFIDVTKLREVEDRRRESETRFEIMANTAPVLVWIADVDKGGSWFNKEWLRYTGRTMEQEVGNGWTEGIHPDDFKKSLNLYVSSCDARKEFYMEYRLRNHAGEYRWVSDNGVPRYTPDGIFEGYIGACIDIHQQKLAAEKLIQSEHRLKQILETSPTFMCVLKGPNFIFEQANAGYFQAVGHRDILGKPMVEALPEMAGQEIIEALEGVRKTGKPFVAKERPLRVQLTPSAEPELRYMDFVYQIDASNEGGDERIFVHGVDITDKVLARTAVEVSKAAIENERANFRNLFRQTPELVCILRGRDHLFEFVNEAHIAVLGFDATGMTVRRAQPESVEIHGILDNVFDTGITAELNEIPVTVGKRLRFFNLTYSARYDVAGKVNGVMILGTEITDQIVSRDATKAQKAALELTLKGASSEEVLTVLTNLVELQLGNGAIASTLMLDPTGERLVHGAAPNLPSEYNQVVHNLRIGPNVGSCGAAAFRNEPVIVEDIEASPQWADYLELTRKFGLRACWSMPVATAGGKVLGTFAVYYKEKKSPTESDRRLLQQAARTTALVVERKQAQDTILRSKKAADEARAAAELASESKTRFLANMSHEIRTPLAAILGFSDLLQHEQHLANSEAGEYLQRISRNASHLGRLIDELLDLSKIEADKLEIDQTEFSLAAAAEDSLSSITHMAQEKSLPIEINIDSRVPKKIVSDPTRFRQVLLNVIGNAVKFTDTGSVEVNFTLDPSDHQMLCVRVTDTGIGLTDEQRSNLFKPFVQADNSVTRKYGGTGLGLALSKKLAQLMGGDLIIEETQVGRGSTFLFTIKLLEPKAKTLDSGKAQLQSFMALPLKGKRVLIVDDAPDNQTIIRLFITKAGGEVEIAANGQEGLEKMRQRAYDMVLMDIQMPVLDGYQALQAAIGSGYTAPIVAITAHAMKDEKIRCLEAGFRDYLSKPVNRTELINKIVELTH